MKKILALVLCLVFLLATLAGCSVDKKAKGESIKLYMSSEIYSFDPAQAYIDEAAQQVLALLYEGLFTLDEDGERVKAGCSSYKIVDDEKNHYIELTLRKSYWSDSRQVQAADYVFAFKRLIESEMNGEAAAMLMDVKNAYDIKHQTGDKPLSIDDLGVTDVAVDVLKIEFDYTVDYEQFLDYLASPLLVPLRDDAVNKASEWASNASIIVCNGPFFVRSFTAGEGLVLERNTFYDRNPDRDALMKSVTPYRIEMAFNTTAEDNLAAFQAGELAFLTELPISARNSEGIEVVDTNTMSQMSLMFNTRRDLVSNAKVRKALSMAIDRTELAELLVYAKAATGIVGTGVYELSEDDGAKFRENGDVFSSKADVDGAKALLKEAGISAKGKTIEVVYRNNSPTDIAAFEYVKTAWEALGFTVKAKDYKLFTKFVDSKTEYDLCTDNVYKAYLAQDDGIDDYDVLIYDMLMSSTDPFSILAPFAKNFSGNQVKVSHMNIGSADDAEEAEVTPHASGYDSEAYNALIDQAFAIKTDNEERAKLLHDAEKLLAEDCPVVPLVEYQRYFMISEDLSKTTQIAYGVTQFKKAKLDVDEAAPVAKKEETE